MNNPQQKNQIYDWFLTWAFRNGEMCRLAGVAKKALRGDNPGTPLAKNPFGGDDDRGRFAKGPEKAQVTDGLFSSEEIIHFAIVTARALFGHTSSLPRPFLASALPNPSPRSHFLAIRAIFALGGTNPTHPAEPLLALLANSALGGTNPKHPSGAPLTNSGQKTPRRRRQDKSR